MKLLTRYFQQDLLFSYESTEKPPSTEMQLTFTKQFNSRKYIELQDRIVILRAIYYSIYNNPDKSEVNRQMSFSNRPVK